MLYSLLKLLIAHGRTTNLRARIDALRALNQLTQAQYTDLVERLET